MTELEEKTYSKSFWKKIEKKQKRIQLKIFDEIHIKCTNQPTTNLLICNAGLVNGFTEEKLVSLCEPFGEIDKVIMLPGKSYCFIVFKFMEDSINAFNTIHGKINMAQDGNSLFLSFTETIPDIKLKWSNNFPNGLILYENFVSLEEEEKLLTCINLNEMSSHETGKILKQRQVKHYGYEFRYDINNVDKNLPLPQKIPNECSFLTERLLDRGFENEFCPDQLTVNIYQPGQGIPPHVDTHSAFEDPILSLSLGSSVVMDFHHRDGRHIPVILPRRSLLVMSQDARYDWIHGIASRTMDTVPSESGLTVQIRDVRASFTFRKILHDDECHCSFEQECDTAKGKKKLEIENNLAVKLEKTYVHSVYDAIASHFSDTRQKPWPNVLDFVMSFDTGSILIDVGCGNGKYLGRNSNIFDIGCDRSIGLLNVCQEKGYQTFECDCLYLPLRSNIADGCISIAVIHHLANEERRLQAISEIVRVLKPDGRALIYVWATDQTKDDEKSSYLKQDRKNRGTTKLNDNNMPNIETPIDENLLLPVHTNRTEFQHKDLLVPWKTKNPNVIETQQSVTFLRFYHIFEPNELEMLCMKLSNIEVVKTYYDQGNWCIMFRKIRN